MSGDNATVGGSREREGGKELWNKTSSLHNRCAILVWEGCTQSPGTLPSSCRAPFKERARRSSGEIQLSSQDGSRSPCLPYPLHNQNPSNPTKEGHFHQRASREGLASHNWCMMQDGHWAYRWFIKKCYSWCSFYLIFPPFFVSWWLSLKNCCFHQKCLETKGNNRLDTEILAKQRSFAKLQNHWPANTWADTFALMSAKPQVSRHSLMETWPGDFGGSSFCYQHLFCQSNNPQHSNCIFAWWGSLDAQHSMLDLPPPPTSSPNIFVKYFVRE